jgi:hypothetical protein
MINRQAIRRWWHHVAIGKLSRSSTAMANPAWRQRRRIEIFQTALDRAACEPRDIRGRREAAQPAGAYLARSEQPSSALVPLRAIRLPLLEDLKRIVEPATLGDPVPPLLWVSKSLDKKACHDPDWDGPCGSVPTACANCRANLQGSSDCRVPAFH